MDPAPQFAAQIAPWLIPVVLLTVFGLMWRSMLRLEDRLGKRIDDTNTRIDGMNASLGRGVDDTNTRIDDMNASLDRCVDGTSRRIDRIDGRLRTIENGQAEIRGKLDFLEAYILGRTDAPPAPAE